jgi:hypothetical protein
MSGCLRQIAEQVAGYLRKRAGLPACTPRGKVIDSGGVSWCV